MFDMQALQDRIEVESAFVEPLRTEIARRIIGQQEMVDQLIIGLLSGGHVLLEGLPGLAKTTAVRTLADALRLDFSRIQFTPDLLPADVIGSQVFNPRDRTFEVRRGPIFANLVLADEINRAPAKVQSALLEAMQEKQVTLGEETFQLPTPFLVLATQNPIEQEGTYPLPEAQIDRFMLHVRVRYPSAEEERRLLDRPDESDLPALTPVLDGEGILRARAALREIHVQDSLKDYILTIVRATRDPSTIRRPALARLIDSGASPRASMFLLLAARAHAFLDRRAFVMPEDIKAMTPEVLRHRIVPSFEAEAEDRTSDSLLQELLEAIDVP